MKRLTAVVAMGVSAAVMAGGAAAAAPTPGHGLRPGEAYAGAGNPERRAGGVGAAQVPAGLKGVDVSSYQGPNVDWAALKQSGVRFAFVKATEGAKVKGDPDSGYVNPYFKDQYNGARKAGLIRGAYHFALPHKSGGARQADYFINNGGGWSTGGGTLPGVLDIEFNPYDNGLDTCYGLKPAQMVGWIRAFSNRYRKRTGRYPIIYTNAYWWNKCTNNNTSFGNHPLWQAHYGSGPVTPPAGWKTYTFWQYAAGTGATGNPSVFNGSLKALRKLAAQARTGFTKVNAGPEPRKKGKKLTVVGRLHYHNGTAWRPLAKRKVSIWFRARGTSKWVRKAVVTTNGKGRFRRKFIARKDGYWRAKFAGGPKFFGVTSGSDYVDVR